MFVKLAEITQLDEKTLVEKALKLTEETGEVAEAVLSYSNAYACGYKGKTNEDIKEECVDVIIMALSIIAQTNNYSIPTKEVIDMMITKMDKWESKVIENKLNIEGGK